MLKSKVVQGSVERVFVEEKKTEKELQAEEALQKSEEKFRNIFEKASDCMIFLDVSGRVLDVNERAVEVFGGSKEEVLGKHFTKVGVLSPRDMPKLLSAFANGLADKHPILNLSIKNKKGQEILLECKGSLTRTRDKLALLVIARDVTERKRMEEALRESEEKYRSMVELAPDGIVAADMKGVITSVNPAFLRWTGYAKDEIVGKHFTKLGTIRTGDIPKYIRLLASAVRGKMPQPFEFTYVRKDGTISWGEAHGSLIKADDKTMGFQAILRDITERKKAEEALRESEEKYKELTESISDTFFAMDKNLRYTYWNKASEKLTGISAKDAIGKSLTEVFPDVRGTRIEQLYLETLGTKQPQSFVNEFQLEGKDFVFEINAYPTKDGLSVFVKDITERKRAEEALQKSQNKSRTLLENLPQKIFFKDKNSVYISCNENYARDLKINSNEITGRTDYDFYPKELAEKYRADDKRIMESGKTEDIEEDYIQDGQKVFVHTVKTPVKDEKGNVVGILGIFWDITERKRAEEELNRLSSAVKMSTDSMVISDLDGKIIDVNEATLKMYSTDDKRDLIGKNSFDLIAPEELEKALVGMKEVLANGYVKSREYHIVTKNGSRIPVEMSVAIMKGVDGKPIGFVGITRDITERKKAEEELYFERKRLFDVLETLPQMICLLTPDYHVAFANRSFREKFGESKGRHCYDYCFGKSKPCDFCEAYEVLKTGKPHHWEVAGPDGTVIDAYDFPFTDTDGTPMILELDFDITERKKMEEKVKLYSEHLEELVQKRSEELLESEKRYSVLVEEAGDGVIILQDGKIVFTNKKAAETIGYSKGEMIGLSLEKLVDEGSLPLAKEMYERNLHGETPTTFEVKWIAKTGERIPFEASGARVNYEGRPAVLRVVRDIRERKRMEEQRLKLERLAALGELATMVGHDLRNPLQSIENAAYYIKTECASKSTCPIPQKTKEMLQVIDNSINYADKIIRDLQDFSTTRPPKLEKTDINILIKETLSQVNAPEKVQLTTELARLSEINVDQDQMKRVFLNLTINAIQAMENGGTLTISTKQREGAVEISFKDTGTGISKENMEKIFTPFFTTRAKGMGMGLPICKKFVESHSGSIRVESEAGKGTTFTVKLPIQQERR